MVISLFYFELRGRGYGWFGTPRVYGTRIRQKLKTRMIPIRELVTPINPA